MLGCVFDMENSTVRNNLMNQKGYAPYCGGGIDRCIDMPRSKWDVKLNQFKCPKCGWVSEFPDDFIQRYKTKWGL